MGFLKRNKNDQRVVYGMTLAIPVATITGLLLKHSALPVDERVVVTICASILSAVIGTTLSYLVIH